MKQGFIGAVCLVLGVVVLVVWARTVILEDVPEEWPPSLVSGQLLAVGGWLSLLGTGVATLWRTFRRTKLFRTGDRLHARAGVVTCAGYALAALGMTAVAWSAVFDLLGARVIAPCSPR